MKIAQKWGDINGIGWVLSVQPSNRMHRIHRKHVSDDIANSGMSAGQGCGWMSSNNFPEDQQITQK